MSDLLPAIHLIGGVFLVGPAVAAAMYASRVVRQRDLGQIRLVTRMARVFGWAMLAVVLAGVAMVRPNTGWAWSQPWVWISFVLAVVTSMLLVFRLAPLLERAAARIEADEDTSSLVARTAWPGMVASVLVLATMLLMVYKPGA